MPPVKPGGCPAAYPRRAIVNGLRHMLCAGCAWCLLPPDLPPWQRVYHDFRTWRQEGVWQVGPVAPSPTRRSSPRAAILDSPSVQTTDKGGCGATTRARRGRAANGIRRWIPGVGGGGAPHDPGRGCIAGNTVTPTRA